MIYKAQKGQISYGEEIGIIMMDAHVPFIQGDIGHAATFSFPVRYQYVPGLTVNAIYNENIDIFPQVVTAGKQLIQEGNVKAITGNCGYFLTFQEELVRELNVPVFMSSLLQLSLLEKMIDPTSQKIGIITAESYRLSDDLLQAANIDPASVHMKGMEQNPHFVEVAIQENGILDSEKLEQETVQTAMELVMEHPDTAIVVIECSILSPYSKAVQQHIKRPVYDYISLVNFVHAGL
ncbi:aspartate/glutamate racemase family protein [Alteribacillus iranensis]|uniref:Aspartate/glutamate racemase family protein n=1 Tax=Alteribacillus iranensis TaxID=930128 RepID=A0A1I2B6Q5_9BACI|nr:aspartate/glutamate racemase family protein [Alteribacillus iranensis]SFE51003.1 hypothetical protein SAMN05192532_10275 [Alteribacillus iranensis]